MNMAMLNILADIVKKSNWTMQLIHDGWGFETIVSYFNKFYQFGVCISMKKLEPWKIYYLAI